MDDPVAVALEGVAGPPILAPPLGMEPAARAGRIGRKGRMRVRTHYRRWSGLAVEGGWQGEGRRAGQAARPRNSTPPATFHGQPRSGGLSFAARTSSIDRSR